MDIVYQKNAELLVFLLASGHVKNGKLFQYVIKVNIFGRTFVKQTSLYHVILLIYIQGVLLLWMDLWRTHRASLVKYVQYLDN